MIHDPVGPEFTTVPPADHVGCVMTIVGSRRFRGADWHHKAEQIIVTVLSEHRPIIVISGGAPGIDTLAQIKAGEMGYAFTLVKPTVFTWEGPGGLKERNTQMATACGCLIRIGSRSSTTYGSGWTADHAEGLGKHVERYLIGLSEDE